MIYKKRVKWRKGASYLQEYFYADGWFYGQGVGPYKTEEKARQAMEKADLYKRMEHQAEYH